MALAQATALPSLLRDRGKLRREICDRRRNGEWGAMMRPDSRKSDGSNRTTVDVYLLWTTPMRDAQRSCRSSEFLSLRQRRDPPIVRTRRDFGATHFDVKTPGAYRAFSMGFVLGAARVTSCRAATSAWVGIWIGRQPFAHADGWFFADRWRCRSGEFRMMTIDIADTASWSLK